MKNKPLVLIVDDSREYGEKILPEFCANLGADSITACDVHGAVQAALKHTSESERPLNLIILDMHLPTDSDHLVNIDTQAGITVLSLSALRIFPCPILIFTAYPSYRNCVESVKAGATAYISKVRNDDEGGPEEFFKVCQELLFPKEPEVQPKSVSVLTDEWLKLNYQWLVKHFQGKWVSFVPEEAARKAGLTDAKANPARDGLVILSGDTYTEVRKQVASSPVLYLEYPPILRVAANGNQKTERND